MISDLKPYAEYKESGLPWLGQVPGHWEVRRLRASITDCVNGIWGADPNGREDLICVRVADFDRVSLRVSLRKKTVRAIPLSVRPRRLLKKGDLLLEKSGGGDLQPVGAVVAFDHDTPAVCSNFVARMPLAAGYDTFFLNYLHSTLYAYRINVRSIKQTTGIQNLDGKAYLAERVAFPPPAEQAAIVRFLDWANGRLERAIRAKRKVIALLNEQKQAIIHRAVTRGLDPSVPLKDSGVPWLGEIPKHWEVRKVREIAQVVNGYPFDSRLFTLDRGHPLIRIRDLNKAATAVRFRGPFIEAARIQRGEVLIGMDGDFNVGTWGGDEDALLNQRMCCVRSRSPALNEYLRDALARPLREINELTYATTVKHLASSQVERISIGVPPRAELEDVVRYMRKQHLAYGERISRLEREITLLREYRTRLVADVVTGKLDVRAAAASLPDEAPLDDLAASRDPDDDALDTDDLTDTEADA
jgi:type I restriction enzyme S subunit